MGAPQDAFSAHAGVYARHRPRYPAALFDYLAGIAPGRALAWDCGAGNGQAALALAERFDRVIATDISAAQLAEAPRHAGVEYRCVAAEEARFDDASLDLVTVAQAVHWFDLPRFFALVRQALRPGGVIAVWCYKHTCIAPDIDRIVQSYYSEVVGAFWAPCVNLADEGYRTIAFPFDELAPPRFTSELAWSFDDLLGYLDSWSATQAARRATGRDPRDAIRAELVAVWGDPQQRRGVSWLLNLRVGRK